MSKSISLPASAITVTTYAALERILQAFGYGHLNLLMLLGSPGVGKTRTAARVLRNPLTGWIEGHATGFGLYGAFYEHREKRRVVLDDVDSLYRDRAAVRLLKVACQTDPTKALGWLSDAPTLAREGIPKSFTTTCNVCLIANEWRTLSVNVAAIEDRGCVVFFNPNPLEVHRAVATWFWDQEVHDFIGENLGLLDGPPSCRTYITAEQFKKAGLDWKEMILSRWKVPANTAAVLRLKADPSFKNEEARAKAFIAMGHGCRATYFNVAKAIKGKVCAATPISVMGSPPVVATTPIPSEPTEPEATLPEPVPKDVDAKEAA